MIIHFQPLHESHFLLLLKWLETPHVKKWWDRDVTYTMELVKEKFGSYAEGYKVINGVHKPIHSFIIHKAQTPVGYIQLYNAYDFPRDKTLNDLPVSLGAIDLFIGDLNALGMGCEVIKVFLNTYALKSYNYVFVDPEYTNARAVRAYEKAGFVILKRVEKTFWMVAHHPVVRLSIQDSLALEVSFRKHFLKDDRLWLFGSRANLSKKGGDIDLYIETHIQSVDEAVRAEKSFWIDFEEAIGEQKIDIVLNLLSLPTHLRIYDVAQKEGVRIV